MLIVHVHVQVKPGCVEAFKTASLDNARQSVQEAGIARLTSRSLLGASLASVTQSR
jgi:quinol monooxygenase YgiN